MSAKNPFMKDYKHNDWYERLQECTRCYLVHHAAEAKVKLDLSGAGIRVIVAPTICDCACHLYPVRKVKRP